MNTLYIITREEWRQWLEKYFDKEPEIWLVYPKKASGKPRIEYNTAVEEALCFGWIDSTVKALDTDHTIQRFTVRKPKSTYSQANKERLRWLWERSLIHASIKDQVKPIIDQPFIFPSDIVEAIQQEEACWNNYQQFSESYKRIRIAYVHSARKRPEEFQKRLKNFIQKTRENKLIKGYGGIDKYY